MYGSPEETLAALKRVGYFTDTKTATTVFLAGKLHRPVMLEGPAGAGKTEIALSVACAYGVRLLRLQFYQGINEEKAIGQFDKSLQELYVLLMSKAAQAPDWNEIKREITSRAYFMAGPLLEAIEQEKRCVLPSTKLIRSITRSKRKHLSGHAAYLAWAATSTTLLRYARA
jgi:MoxR-like ATPase